MDVKLVYTDSARVERGYLHNFSVDVDVAEDKDFEITVAKDNHILRAGSWWYINNTEYGGIVDAIGVVTADREIRYSGRNFRGVLDSKVIEPPSGEDYKVVSGYMLNIVNELLAECGLNGMFKMTGQNWEISSFQFNRYITLYDAICALVNAKGYVLRMRVKNGFVTLYSSKAVDYTNDKDYMRSSSIDFNVTMMNNKYNHLICLGQGELKDRQVLHLYIDQKGNIAEKQVYKGLKERTAVYDYSGAKDAEELRTGGIAKLKELNADSLDMTLPDMSMNIGDVIGGTEQITKLTVKQRITNIIAKISDDSIDIEYSVS